MSVGMSRLLDLQHAERAHFPTPQVNMVPVLGHQGSAIFALQLIIIDALGLGANPTLTGVFLKRHNPIQHHRIIRRIRIHSLGKGVS